MILEYQHIIGIIFLLTIIILVGIYSGKKVKTSSDFSIGGRRTGTGMVAGTIMGTLVGGSSTIGTAQLAFLYGFSAWWFTLGAGLGCFCLALFFAKSLYSSNKETIPQILAAEFGGVAGPISSIFISLGTFLNIIAQILAAIALLTSMFKMSVVTAAVLSVVLMASYVLFGGLWGTGIVGIAKLIFLYLSATVGGLIAFKLGGGLKEYISIFPKYPYFSLFGRGVCKDGSAGFSLILGVLSTQTYIQAIFSARTLRIAKAGTIISAILIPLVGLAGIFVGLFMKMNYSNMDPAMAFPMFVLNHMNPWFGGIVLATLLVTIVGTGSGLSLGISTMFTKDIYKEYINKKANDKRLLYVSRLVIVASLILALLFITDNAKSLIMQWSFMSMGLRGATVFGPLCAALFIHNKVNKFFAIASMILSPVTVLICEIVLGEKVDSLFSGVCLSLILILLGRFKHKKVIPYLRV